MATLVFVLRTPCRVHKKGSKMKLKPYPTWVCIDCARETLRQNKHRNPFNGIATFHIEACNVCGDVCSVTEPRDFDYPKFKGHVGE